MLGLKRRKRKRLVEMTNAEAAEYYVERAEVAAENGQSARARSLFHSAVMHDPTNLRAKQGLEATERAPMPSPRLTSPDRGRERSHRQRRAGVGFNFAKQFGVGSSSCSVTAPLRGYRSGSDTKSTPIWP